ncbi:MAG TPA: HAMP domain-containing sensor histidine kinase [Longimicrobiales bacterium]
MTVRTRLLLTWTGVAFLLLLPALYAVSRLDALRDIAFEQRGRYAEAFLELGQLQVNLTEFDRFLRSYVAAPDPALREGARQSLTEARGRLSRLAAAGYDTATAGTAAALDTIADATRRLEELVAQGRTQEATALLEAVKPTLARSRESLGAVARSIDERSRADLLQARNISAAAASTTLAAVAIAVALALGLGLWTTGALTIPLRRLRRAMAAVAGGEFVAAPDLPYTRTDEIGDLTRSYRSMTGRLAELDRVRAEFLSMASHDLKTPISVIVGYAELIEDGVYGTVTDQQREALRSIREQTDVLTRLVQQLLDSSRIEAGGLRIHKTETDLIGLLTGVERAFDALARSQRIDFAVEADPALPETIRADGDRLRDQVLGNLLTNAFKFTPAGGRIRLRARAADRRLHLEVSDTGAGIPPDEVPHIFEKFYQAGRAAREAGAGLGLAIARDVVEAHGGTISAESRLGRGTTFRIELPI